MSPVLLEEHRCSPSTIAIHAIASYPSNILSSISLFHVIRTGSIGTNWDSRKLLARRFVRAHSIKLVYMWGG